jgi:acylphosphatase
MVKASSILNLGLIGAIVIGGYMVLKNGAGIGSFLGNSFGSIGSSITDSINQFGVGLSSGVTNTSAVQKANTLQLGGTVTNLPSGNVETFSSKRDKTINDQLLALGGLFQQENISSKINVSDRSLTGGNQGDQPLDFIFDKVGKIKTGQVGVVGDWQSRFASTNNLITFDQAGNVSNIGGLTSSG